MSFELPHANEPREPAYADVVLERLRTYHGTADLHLYSDASVGTEGLFKLCRAARIAGLDHVAVTDRERLLTQEEADEFSVMCGVDVIPGVELTCRHEVAGRPVLLQVGLLWPPEEDPELQALLDRSREQEDVPTLKWVLETVKRHDRTSVTRTVTVLYSPVVCHLDWTEAEALARDFRVLGGVGLEVWSPLHNALQTETLLGHCAVCGLIPTGGSGRCCGADEFLPMEPEAFQAVAAYHLREEAVAVALRQSDGEWLAELSPELADALRRRPFCVPGYWSRKRLWGLLYLTEDGYEEWLQTVMLLIENSAAAVHTRQSFRQVVHTAELNGTTLRIPAPAARFAKLETGGHFYQPFREPVLFLTGAP